MARYIDADVLSDAVIQSKNNNRHSDTVLRLSHDNEHRHFLAMIDAAPTADVSPDTKWISVKERPPESGEACLLACKATNCYSRKTHRYVCEGFYIERWKEEVRYDVSEDQAIEYNEETDEYYLCEGWYERIHNWDDYISVYISDTVTHWRPLPEPPKEEGE